MAFANNIITTLFGRRLGLQAMTTSQTGGAAATEFLVGPDSFREAIQSETTGTNLRPFGTSLVPGTSAGSSSVYTLEPPIPGVRKVLAFNTTANGAYVKTANAETFLSTVGSSFTTIKSTAGGCLGLIGLTTAIWGAFDLTSGTSSQASGFSLSTTT